ncbi:MAG: RsbRD N-terminal domain-containing protein [Acidobacteria bacterium]|nr:RsbRD N-terminal domain-containing protein [Acidobacteriota bacterium]
MPDTYISLFREHQETIIRRWIDEVYRERRTELPETLSFGQLVDHYPEMLDELARLLDERASRSEIIETARRRREHAHVRFQRGVLIDEVARELMLFRRTINDFLWREGLSAALGDLRELRDALQRADQFVDEMITQAVVVYAASWRPPVETRTSVWPPPRRRKTDFPESDA